MSSLKDKVPAALAKIEHLIAAPRTLGRALMLLRDPQSDLGDIARLIAQDPALTADVLRCANSAFYGAGLRVTSISGAVQKIGFRETLRLLTLVVAHTTAARDLGSYGIAAEDSWTESLFSGICLEILARDLPEEARDEAYAAGLLRFIGRLAINQAIDDLGGGLFWDATVPLATWETENVGLTQAAAGALLLRRWKFAESLASAIEQQDAADANALREPLTQALHFLARLLPAGATAEWLLRTDEAEPGFPASHPYAVQHTLTPERVGEVLRESRERFVAVRDQLAH